MQLTLDQDSILSLRFPFGFSWVQRLWISVPSLTGLLTLVYKPFFLKATKDLKETLVRVESDVKLAKSNSTIVLDEKNIKRKRFIELIKRRYGSDILDRILTFDMPEYVHEFYVQVYLIDKQFAELYNVLYDNTYNWTEEEMIDEGWEEV